MDMAKREAHKMRHMYVIRDSVSGRVYVGSTRKPESRIKAHFYALRRRSHPVELMQSDYNAHGEAAFEFRVGPLEPHWEGVRMEVFVMKLLKSQDPKYGYNYKDKRRGASRYAIEDRWRTSPTTWSAARSRKRVLNGSETN